MTERKLPESTRIVIVFGNFVGGQDRLLSRPVSFSRVPSDLVRWGTGPNH